MRIFIRHVIILILTTTVVSCYNTGTIPTLIPQNYNSNSYAHKNYAELNTALQYYQEAAKHPAPPLPGPKLLKLGDNNNLVVILREHLEQNGDLSSSDNTKTSLFDTNVREAVKSFQLRHGIKPDGMVGEGTRLALNVPPEVRLRQIQLSMQRWEQLEAAGDHYLLVNIPAYQVYLIENDRPVLNMKAIVGRPTRPTPELQSTINQLVFNPYWHVPVKIAKNDILPKVQENPEYLDENNIQVFHRGDKTKPLDDGDIDWNAVNQSDLNYDFRQEPGEENSLGVVKFQFPNSHDVYLHDTPAKTLFDSDNRDLSSGCIRLEKPFELVDYLIQGNPEWDGLKTQEVLLSHKTTYVSLHKPLPVVLTYITAWVDETGKVNFRDDIYHLN